MPVIVAHELLDAFEDIAFTVAESVGDFRLRFEGEQIGGAFASKMEFITRSEKEVVSFFECGEFAFPDVILFAETVDVFDIEANAGHPKRVVVVAESADAVFYVRLLHEDRLAEAGASLALVNQPLLDVGFGVLFAVKEIVGGLESSEKRAGSED